MPIVEGLVLNPTPQGILFASRYAGEPNISGEVRRRRRYVYDAMRRVGSPALVKHRYNDVDVRHGTATTSPAFDDVYGHTYSFDGLSHGVGYCSVETSDDEWYHTTTGEIVTSLASPGASYAAAPKYRGFGPGFLVYIIEPDAALDFFRLGETGALIKVQTAQAIAPWYPDMQDNDLLTNVELDAAGNIVATTERYELKMASPVAVRGNDKRGRRESGADGGNRFVLNQRFEMSLIPSDHPLMAVETDR